MKTVCKKINDQGFSVKIKCDDVISALLKKLDHGVEKTLVEKSKSILDKEQEAFKLFNAKRKKQFEDNAVKEKMLEAFIKEYDLKTS